MLDFELSNLGSKSVFYSLMTVELLRLENIYKKIIDFIKICISKIKI